MKEQAQLKEEMAYQYKLGNFEVKNTPLCVPIYPVPLAGESPLTDYHPLLDQAAAAIQRRLDPDIAM